MSCYEHTLKRRGLTLKALDREIDLLTFRWQQTADEATRQDCREKLATCAKFRSDLLQLDLFAEVSA